MRRSTERRDEPMDCLENSPDSFKPIDRDAFSENALFLLDRYRIDNANDPMAIFVSIVDRMRACRSLAGNAAIRQSSTALT